MINPFNSAARNLSPLIHLFHPINPCAVCLVTQSCLTLCNPMNCYPPGFSVCGFSRQEYWVAMPSSRGSSQPRDRTQVSCIIGRSFFFFFKLEAKYNIVVVFAIHQHESATGVHVSHHPEHPFHLPPHPIPLGCPRAPYSCIEYAQVICFTCGDIHVSMLLSEPPGKPIDPYI